MALGKAWVGEAVSLMGVFIGADCELGWWRTHSPSMAFLWPAARFAGTVRWDGAAWCGGRWDSWLVATRAARRGWRAQVTLRVGGVVVSGASGEVGKLVRQCKRGDGAAEDGGALHGRASWSTAFGLVARACFPVCAGVHGKACVQCMHAMRGMA